MYPNKPASKTGVTTISKIPPTLQSVDRWIKFGFSLSFTKAVAGVQQSAANNISFGFVMRKLRIKRITFDSYVVGAGFTLNENINKTFAMLRCASVASFEGVGANVAGDGVSLFPDILINKGENNFDNLNVDYNVLPNTVGLILTAWLVMGQAPAGQNFNGNVRFECEYTM